MPFPGMSLFRRARHILQTEGLATLLWRTIKFGFFRYETYYPCQYAPEDHRKFTEANFMPRTDNLAFKIISTNQEADKLEADGFEFRSHVEHARERLDKGAIAFCSFIDGEFADIGWIATNGEAARSLGPPPLKVNFDKNEAMVAGIGTMPKYRRMGLMLYNSFKRLEFCRQHGIVRVRVAVATKNAPSLSGTAKVGHEVYAKGYYARVLWWRFWREKPLPQTISLRELTSNPRA